MKGTIPSEGFPLTGFYPLYSDEENVQLDKELDQLIEKTDLFVPEKRTCVITANNLNELKAILNGTNIEITSGCLTDIFEKIASRKVERVHNIGNNIAQDTLNTFLSFSL